MKEIKENVFYEEVINSDIPVVVDFWAPWCGPCRMLTPVMEELSRKYNGKIKFVKVNVEENRVIPAQYRVANIPTIMVFKEGRAIENMVGFRPKSIFERIIRRHI